MKLEVAKKVVRKDVVKKIRKQSNGKVIFLGIETTKNNRSSNAGRVTVRQEQKSSGKVREWHRDE